MRIVITFRPKPDSIDSYAGLIALAFASAKRMGYETVMVGPEPFAADLHLEYSSDAPLMDWILEAQLHYLKSPLFTCESVFFSPDALILRSLWPIFQIDFDVAFTDRPHKRMPINNGVIFVKHLRREHLVNFWEDALQICRNYPDDIRAWYGDQMALADMLHFGRETVHNVRASRLPCSTYNASLPKDCDIVDKGLLAGMVIVHFKGKRKHLMEEYWRAIL